MITYIYFSIIAACMILNVFAFDFKKSLQEAGLENYLRTPHALHIETLVPEKCKQYSVHVQRWVDATKQYPAGIACRCDWIMTQNAFYGKTMEPKVVFVATRALISFSSILDSLKHPIVLLSSINDETIPVNHDSRIALPSGFTANPEKGLWPRILNHSMIIHWFLENHSEVDSPKVSTLPIMFVSKTGTTEPDVLYNELLRYFSKAPQWKHRRTLLMNSDRVRDGHGQWHDREVVRTLCLSNPLCSEGYNGNEGSSDQKKFESDTDGFEDRVSHSKFLIMAHGGGLDPCPKLASSIVLGTIPIIQSNALDDAYKQLPVVIIPSLEAFLHPNNTAQAKMLLDEWGVKYGPYYEPNSPLRKETLRKLSADYWWDQVLKYKPV